MSVFDCLFRKVIGLQGASDVASAVENAQFIEFQNDFSELFDENGRILKAGITVVDGVTESAGNFAKNKPISWLHVVQNIVKDGEWHVEKRRWRLLRQLHRFKFSTISTTFGPFDDTDTG